MKIIDIDTNSQLQDFAEPSSQSTFDAHQNGEKSVGRQSLMQSDNDKLAALLKENNELKDALLAQTKEMAELQELNKDLKSRILNLEGKLSHTEERLQEYRDKNSMINADLIEKNAALESFKYLEGFAEQFEVKWTNSLKEFESNLAVISSQLVTGFVLTTIDEEYVELIATELVAEARLNEQVEFQLNPRYQKLAAALIEKDFKVKFMSTSEIELAVNENLYSFDLDQRLNEIKQRLMNVLS